jgi:hypothetical protein
MAQPKVRGKDDAPIYQRMDRGKVVGSCDGYFDPRGGQLHGPMRPGKTQEDYLPKESRPRYQAWLKRSEK